MKGTKMNIDDLTIGQAKEMAAMLGSGKTKEQTLNSMIGSRVIIRTYSAGVWYGLLDQKAGAEVILLKARRLWRWWCKEGISLSSLSVHGVNKEKSRIAEPVAQVWLEAIEIIPCEPYAIQSIESAHHAKAE